MRAMVLQHPGEMLTLCDLPVPEPKSDQILVKVDACGVCRTDLHILDGELARPVLPLVPGHEIVGQVVTVGKSVNGLCVGDTVGIPWLGWTCEHCTFCRMGRENLCTKARFTGYTLNGGYAEFMLADYRHVFSLQTHLQTQVQAAQIAPLLCAGLIGFRSLRLAGQAERLGLYGFGAAAHIVAQLARHQGREVYAFVRKGDQDSATFARSLGAVWAGDSEQRPPEMLDAAIIYAPVGALVPAALRVVRPGGTVVCAGIHMSDIPSFAYELLWGERTLLSVANLQRRDGDDFLPLAARIPIHTTVHTYDLADANRALEDLRHGRLNGAAVLLP